ncbi:MAG: asparagine synthase (glutamine-hydrolyzing) [Candidatus Pacebacteria bacterium]|nr:asparagine synthase (glutamine-hydrolyzing) [Candidatus Paceibacterota bacterium]
MCGILASYQVPNISKKQIQVVSHRGPDNQTFMKLTPQLAFGHARLSIIDLSQAANQPFVINKRYFLIFNGEIYNYLELKKILQKRGYRFKTNSDTEVLLKSYLCWGKKCLDRFNGMFAFVIFDKKNQTLFAARDRFGIKPLYFHQPTPNSFIICSEIKQILSLKNFQPKANLPRVLEFLSWRILNHTDETLFQDIYQLRGGQYLEINLKNKKFALKKQKRTWYSFKKIRSLSTQSMSETEVYQQFKKLFFNACQLRLRADVPVSVALSGGLDSSSIAVTIDQLDSRGQSFFCARSKNSKYDEFKYAQAVISQVKTKKAQQIYLKPNNLFKQTQQLIKQHDEPVVSGSILMQKLLYQQIKKGHFTVAINGQGADEILGLYGQFYPFINQEINQLHILKAMKESYFFAQKHSKKPSLLMMIYWLLTSLTKQHLYRNHHSTIFSSHDYQLVNPHNQLAQQHGLQPAKNLTDYYLLLTFFTSLPMLLQFDDRNSMAASIESRLPYLDYRLVEFTLTAPNQYRIKNGLSKNLLRSSLKSFLPKKILNRSSKPGFATAQETWLQKGLRSDFKKLLLNTPERFQFIDQKFLNQALNRLHHGPTASLLWRLLMLKFWQQAFNVNF